MSPPRPSFTYLAGIVPCAGGWAVLTARLVAATVVVEEPFVLRHLLDVLDHKPRFDAAAIHAPIGFFDEPVGPYRPCDLLAMEMVGWPRAMAFQPVPSRAAIHARTRQEALRAEPWLTRADLRRLPQLAEIDELLQPFHQRRFVSAHPDLSFHLLNGDRRLTSSPHHEDGALQRVALLRDRLPGVDEIVLGAPPAGCTQLHLGQAAALLWTARRSAGHAASRLPAEPEWDSGGMRRELVR